jgi:hypothetical protein
MRSRVCYILRQSRAIGKLFHKNLKTKGGKKGGTQLRTTLRLDGGGLENKTASQSDS